MKPKIVFFGTPDFAVESLDRLVNSGYDVAAVVTATDKPAGRGHHLLQSAVKQYALAHGLRVLQPEKLKEVANFTIGVFDSIAKTLLNPIVKCFLKPFMKDLYAYVPAFKKMKRDHQEGKDPILRKATALLFIHTPKSYRFGAEDANLAYQNASLMAQSLDISQIYMGFVLTATKQDKKRRLEQMLGIDGKIHAIMALGIPSFQYPNYADRKELRVNKIK